MAGFFDIVISHHKKNKIRAEKYSVFKAFMAAAALFAMADGKRDSREDATLKTLLKTLEDLKLYRTGDGTEMYGEFVDAIAADGEKGREKAWSAIAEVKDDPEQAALVAAISATIIRADGKCPSSKHLGRLSLYSNGGSGSSWFDVKPLGVDGSSGGSGWSAS